MTPTSTCSTWATWDSSPTGASSPTSQCMRTRTGRRTGLRCARTRGTPGQRGHPRHTDVWRRVGDEADLEAPKVAEVTALAEHIEQGLDGETLGLRSQILRVGGDVEPTGIPDTCDIRCATLLLPSDDSDEAPGPEGPDRHRLGRHGSDAG